MINSSTTVAVFLLALFFNNANSSPLNSPFHLSSRQAPAAVPNTGTCTTTSQSYGYYTGVLDDKYMVAKSTGAIASGSSTPCTCAQSCTLAGESACAFFVWHPTFGCYHRLLTPEPDITTVFISAPDRRIIGGDLAEPVAQQGPTSRLDSPGPIPAPPKTLDACIEYCRGMNNLADCGVVTFRASTAQCYPKKGDHGDVLGRVGYRTLAAGAPPSVSNATNPNANPGTNTGSSPNPSSNNGSGTAGNINGGRATSEPAKDSGFSTGSITGIAIGGAAFIIIAGIAIRMKKRMDRKRRSGSDMSETMGQGGQIDGGNLPVGLHHEKRETWAYIEHEEVRV